MIALVVVVVGTAVTEIWEQSCMHLFDCLGRSVPESAADRVTAGLGSRLGWSVMSTVLCRVACAFVSLRVVASKRRSTGSDSGTALLPLEMLLELWSRVGPCSS